MNMPLISVIIPVYKVEWYLPEALDSACAQTYANLEIICIDDGSPDNSGTICDEYAKNDPRIKVIHQANAGVSAARNAGLDIVRGEYVVFMDADDVMDSDLIESLYRLLSEYQADFAACQYRNTPDSANVAESLVLLDLQSDFDLPFLMIVGACARLFKRSIIGSLRFAPYALSEDALFCIHYMLSARKMVISALPKYYYRPNEFSVTHAPYSPKMAEFFIVSEEMIGALRSAGKEKYAVLCEHFYQKHMNMVLDRMRRARVAYYRDADFLFALSAYRERNLLPHVWNNALYPSRADVLKTFGYRHLPVRLLGVYCAVIDALSRAYQRMRN